MRAQWKLAPFGAFGALLPMIISLYQKTETFTFAARFESIFATVIYVVAAAILASIFPYGRRASLFNAALVGILFPTIVGGALAFAKPLLPLSIPESTRGWDAASTAGRWVEAFSLF